MAQEKNKGKVYLIGAGPGDEGLITLKAIKCLYYADVIIYDNLVNKDLLKYTRDNSEKIFVGKEAGLHTLSQDGINCLMVEKANEGKTVARFKGGDPFIFGRGGEEALFLLQHEIEFEVIPGITAADGASAYAGISLTHRNYTSTVAFISGHEDPEKESSGINWEKISTGAGTLVFYMGVKNLPLIAQQLMKHGRLPQTPVAVIERATYNCQRTITGVLEDISAKAAESNIQPPSIIIVGEVVNLRSQLQWFEKRPLFGKKMIVTRSRSQASLLSKALTDQGAVVTEFPTIEISQITDFSCFDESVSGAHLYSWLIFTSVNGIEFFFKRLYHLKKDTRILHHLKIAVIGEETASALRNYGLLPDLVPSVYTSDGLVDAFQKMKTNYSGEKIWFPCSDLSQDIIPSALKKMGAETVFIPVYNNTLPFYTEKDIDAVFDGSADIVTFTSSSTVSNLVKILKNCNREEYIRKIRGFSIGPVTTATANHHGVPVVAEAKIHTIQGLVEAIKSKY